MSGSPTSNLARRFMLPDLVLLVFEVGMIAGPLIAFFTLDAPERHLLFSAGPLVAVVAWSIWVIAIATWRQPIARALRRRRRNEPLDPEMRAEAYHAILRYPNRAMWLRVGLWGAGGTTVALLMHVRAGFPLENVLTVISVTTAHSFSVSVFRALWYERILARVRGVLLPDLDPLRDFADTYQRRLVLAALATGVLGAAGIAAFTYFFIPINLEQYLRLATYFPITIIALAAAWYVYARFAPRAIERYLAAALSKKPSEPLLRNDPRAIAAYRSAQTLPYTFALAKVAFWFAAEALLVVQSVWVFSVDWENAALMAGEAMVMTIGAALYEALWHRQTMRPILTHIAARHRPAPDVVRTPLSLRSKMLAAFGAITFFACGLSLFWSFMQFKTLATSFIQKESELRLDQTMAELRTRGATHHLATDEIVEVLRTKAAESAPPESVRDQGAFYYLPPGPDARPIGVGGGKKGPVALPWTGEALMRRLASGQMELSAQHMTGAYARLFVERNGTVEDEGSIAVLLPGYRNRGPSTVPQIQVLIFFFLVLLATSIGIVILVANDLTRPIRELERRADAMAKGDLMRPVVSAAGEADEVGRLTYAFEEMRRALNDKLRSSTEINLSLEQEVTRRTAELERRNRELKETLDQLHRAQDELVRSEKMASMGRLVAGIAHEINNPVNAVVNTVGPLEETVEGIVGASASEDVKDVKEMIRVIQRGARRTKEIVQALHNYSRGDEDRMVEVDLHRGIDESLELLRHHLKGGITVERRYGEDVPRVRGLAGQLHQVFMNLLTNAAQAISEKKGTGTITITTTRKENSVVIEVADDGPGIPPDLLPRIFDPFFTTKDVGAGSGLGLSIVHGIVERHGGTISVKSEVGKGTTFTVTVPIL